jgi:ABC-type branched-subunit amino acid transport system substrate-binding protein
VTAVVAATALVTGCAADPGGARTGGSCDSPGVSGNEIKIGLVYPDSGPLAAALNATRGGFVARLGEANAAGGVNGRKIVYDWRDDRGDLGQNAFVTRQLVADDHVFGLVEATTASSGGAAYLRDQGVPVTGVPVGPEWSDHSYPNMFATGYLGPTGESVTTFGELVKAAGGTRAAIIGSDVTSATNTLGLQVARSLEAVGVTVVPQRFVYHAGTTNVVQLVARLRAANVNVITGGLTAGDLTQIMTAARAAGQPRNTIYMASDAYDASLLQEKGQQMAGMYTWLGTVPWDANIPALQTYRQAMASYSPELQLPEQNLALAGYTDADLFLTGLRKAGACPTRAAFIKALRNTDDYTADGLLASPAELRDWGHMSTCYTFERVNAQGTGYDLVPGPGGATSQWCGTLLAAQ